MNKILIGTGIAIVLLVLGFLVLARDVDEKSESSLSTTTVPSQKGVPQPAPSKNETSQDWNVYTGDQWSFSYPSTWEVREGWRDTERTLDVICMNIPQASGHGWQDCLGEISESDRTVQEERNFALDVFFDGYKAVEVPIVVAGVTGVELSASGAAYRIAVFEKYGITYRVQYALGFEEAYDVLIASLEIFSQ